MYQDAFPRSIFFCSALAEWYIIPSSMPATVNTPPTMAHTPVRKCVKDRLCSVSWTIIGLRSYMKNTPVISQRNGTVIERKNESCCSSHPPRLSGWCMLRCGSSNMERWEWDLGMYKFYIPGSPVSPWTALATFLCLVTENWLVFNVCSEIVCVSVHDVIVIV